MAISQTSMDYSGRKVDLSIFPGIEFPGVPVIAELTENPKAVAGPSKAGADFTRCLFTPLGHYKSEPNYGSNFLTRMNSGRIRYATTLNFIFNSEAKKIIPYLASRPNFTVSDDERFSTLSVKSSFVDRTQLSLVVEGTLASGQPVEFLLPIVWNV
jgi:hypothetical protein